MCFKYIPDLGRHKKTHKAENLLCGDCNKVFKGEHNLKRHVIENRCRIKEQEQVKVYQCGACNKTCNRHWNLVRHMKMHNGVNDKLLYHEDKGLYRCTICLKSFTKKCNCDRHMKYVHSPVWRLWKSLCGLKLHIIKHK